MFLICIVMLLLILNMPGSVTGRGKKRTLIYVYIKMYLVCMALFTAGINMHHG